MNKMDLDSLPHVSEEKPPTRGLLGLIKGVVIFALPIMVLLGGVALFMLIVATGPKPKEKDSTVHPPAVQFAVATARAAAISINVQGEVRPRTGAAIAAQVAGRVVWADPRYVEGGSFQSGQTLVRIDDANYRLAVVRANSQVAQAQEALAREEAEAELARQDWQALGHGNTPNPLAVREPQLAQARAQLAAAQASARSAQIDLERTNVRAPFTGRVQQRRANLGDYVGPGVPVAEMFATDVMEVRIPLTDADLTSLRTPVGFTAAGANSGAPAHLSVAGGGGVVRRWEGRLVRTEATVDARTRLVYGVVEVRDPFGARQSAPLAPGMFVNVVLDGSNRETLVAAPRSALKRNEFVYVIRNDNTIDVRPVRTAQTTADEVLFREGVQNGERVVVSPMPSARNGMAVTPMARTTDTQQQPVEIRR